MAKEQLNKTIVTDEERKERWIDKYVYAFESEEYICWLQHFTDKFPEFSSNAWQYFATPIQVSDMRNVKDLEFFHEGIGLYAFNNYIYPVLQDNKYFFRISYNNVGYEIGQKFVNNGPRQIYCKRVELTDTEEFIPFEDIMTNTPQENVPNIEEQLGKLSSVISETLNNQVPAEAILDIFLSEVFPTKSSALKRTREQGK